MAREARQILMEINYHAAAQEYLRKLPLEHFMEATPQARQREITLESLALVRAQRADFHLFNELLVQYPLPRKKKPGQVVPDNMVVLHPGPLNPEGSYDVPLQPAPPFWVLEYVSKGNSRMDYEDNMHKYEQELKVPYFLLFYPEHQELILNCHTGERYRTVLPNEQGRYAIPEIEVEMAILDKWVRFWYRGELLPLPGEMLNQLTTEREARQTAEAELARLRAELEQRRRGQGNEG
jgi:Uma2 family endonuclease